MRQNALTWTQTSSLTSMKKIITLRPQQIIYAKGAPSTRTALPGESNKEWGVWGGIYLKDGKIDKEFNAHKDKEDWFNVWESLTMEVE